MFGGEGGNAYFCGEKNEEAMTLLLDLLSELLLIIGITFAVMVPFMWIPFVPSVARWMEKMEKQNEKEKEEKKKKKARMKAIRKPVEWTDEDAACAWAALDGGM